MSRAALRLLAFLSLACGLYVVTTTVLGVAANIRPMPHRDQWGTVAEVRDIHLGEYPLQRLVQQHNEHRIAAPRLLFYADAFGAGLRGWLLPVFTILQQMAHVVLLVVLLRLGGERRPAVLVTVAGALLALFFSFAQMENLVDPFQVQFPMVYLAATGALAAVGMAPYSSRPRTLLAVAIASAVLASFSMANGLGVWPLMVLLALRLRPGFWSAAAIAAVGAATCAFYLTGFGWADPYCPPRKVVETAGLRRPDASAAFLATYLGAPVRLPDGFQRPLAAVVAGATGLAIWIAMARRCWTRAVRREDAVRRVAVCVALFVLGSALLTTYGRATPRLLHGMSPRYATPALVFWGALLVFAVLSRRGILRAASFALCGTMVVAAAASNQALVLHERNYSARVRATATGLLLGVTDIPRMSEHLTHDPERDLGTYVPFLRENRLSLFHAGDWPLAGRPLADLGRPAGDCEGCIEEIEVCRESGWCFTASGWALYAPEALTPARVLFTDENGVLLGYAEVGSLRPDVEAVFPQVAGRRVGFRGYGVVRSAGATVRLLMQTADGRLFRGRRARTVANVELSAVPGEPALAEAESRGSFGHGRVVELPGGPFDAEVSTDSGTGYCKWGPLVASDPALELVVPVTTGDCGFGMRIAVVDGESRATLRVLRPPSLRGQWRLWRCELPAAFVGRPLFVVALDGGTSDGQRVGIGAPGWLRTSD